MMGLSNVPFREASRGRISKMSTPSIFPRISRRSRPVDCSRSVGTEPGAAPGPTRSSSVLMSVLADLLASMALGASVVRAIAIFRDDGLGFRYHLGQARMIMADWRRGQLVPAKVFIFWPTLAWGSTFLASPVEIALGGQLGWASSDVAGGREERLPRDGSGMMEVHLTADDGGGKAAADDGRDGSTSGDGHGGS